MNKGGMTIGFSMISAQTMGNENTYYCNEDGLWYLSPLPCEDEYGYGGGVCHAKCTKCGFEGDCNSVANHWCETDSNTHNNNSNNTLPETGSAGGGSGSAHHSNNNDHIEEDCESIPMSDAAKAKLRQVLSSLDKSSHFTYGERDSIIGKDPNTGKPITVKVPQVFSSFSEYLSEIAKTPQYEHGASFDYFEDNSVGMQYGLRMYFNNSNNSVEVCAKYATVIDIHNHPVFSAPSPQDLYVLSSNANQYSDSGYKYQGEIVINCNAQDTIIYFMKVEDRESLKKLYVVLENNVDHNGTHNFIKNGACFNYLIEQKSTFKSLSEVDESLLKLQLIANYYTDGKGLSITKYSWSKGKLRTQGDIRTYGVKKAQNKRGKVVYKPIKC